MAIGYSLIHFPIDSKGCSAEAFSARGVSNLNIDADAANVEIPGNKPKQASRRLLDVGLQLLQLVYALRFTAGNYLMHQNL
jgi:hypothetical protein